MRISKARAGLSTGKVCHRRWDAYGKFRRQVPEVGAGCIKVHVRICAGGAGQLASLPRPSGNIVGTFKQTAGCFRQDNSYHCVRSAADDVPGRMRVLTRTRSLLQANKTLINRIDLATPLSSSSRLATGLSALAPAQRAGGVLGMLSSLEVKVFCPT